MKGRSKLAGLVLVVVALVLAGLALPRQPACEGRPLSAWLADLDLGSSRSHEKAERAVREIGSNAFPVLGKMLCSRDRGLKKALINFNASHSSLQFPVTPASVARQRAVRGYNVLGARARE